MTHLTEKEFLLFLEETLCAESSLFMDTEIPEELFDSIGKFILVAAIEKELGKKISLAKFMQSVTPKDIFLVIYY